MSLSTPETHRNRARTLLYEQLHNAADFDAFCLDFFPAVYQRFPNSMERQAKTNLLLELVPAEAIVKALVPAPSSAPKRSRSWLKTALLVGSLLTVCGLGFAIVRFVGFTRIQQTAPPALQSTKLLPQSAAPNSGQPVPQKPPSVSTRKAAPSVPQHVVIDVETRAGELVELLDKDHVIGSMTAERRSLRMSDGRDVPDGFGVRLALDLVPGSYGLRCRSDTHVSTRSVEIKRKRVDYEVTCP